MEAVAIAAVTVVLVAFGIWLDNLSRRVQALERAAEHDDETEKENPS
jgi:hypothetical protein